MGTNLPWQKCRLVCEVKSLAYHMRLDNVISPNDAGVVCEVN